MIVTGVLVALVFLLPLVWWPGSAGFGFPKSALLLVLAVCLAARQVRWQEGGTTKAGQGAAALWLLVAAAGVSVAVHPSRHGAWSLLLLIAWVTIVHGLVSSPEGRLVRTLMNALFLGMALAVGLDLLYRVGVPWPLPVPHGADPGVATVGNRNYTAGAAAVLFWLGIALAAWTRSVGRRVLISLLSGLLLWEIILVGAAGAMLAVAGGGMVALAAKLASRRRGLFLSLLPATGLAVSLVAGMLLAGGSIPRWGEPGQPGAFVGRLAGEASVGKRARMWQAATWMFMDHPIAGVGLGRYRTEWPAAMLRQRRGAEQQPQRSRSTVSHQDYLQWLAETGLIGLLALLIVLACWRRVVIGGSSGDTMLSGGLVAGLIHALVSFPAHLPVTSLAWGLALAGVLRGRDVGTGVETGRRHRSAVAWGLLASVLGCAVVWEGGMEVLRQRADRRAVTGRTVEAAADWQRVARWSLRPRLTPLWLALFERSHGRDTRAERLLRDHLADMPTDQGYRELARLLVEHGRYREAVPLLDRASALIQKRSDLSTVNYLRGVVAKELGDTTRARMYWERALERYARNHRAHLGLGYLDLLAGDTAGARNHYRRAEAILARELERARSGEREARAWQLEREREIVERALSSLRPASRDSR